MTKDMRKHERFDAQLEVEVTWPDHGVVVGNTIDLSDGGTLVEATFNPPPPVGTELYVRLTATVEGGDPPVLRAKVVRVGPKGMALQFSRDNLE